MGEGKVKNRRTLMCIFLLVVMIATGCTPADQRLVSTIVADAANTAVAMAKTNAPSFSTEIAKAGGTAISEAGKFASTEAARVRLTTEANLKTEAAKILQPGAKKKPVLDYFALGDSIASGHGLMDDNTECHRSTKAYPAKLRDQLKASYDVVNFTHLACSGATAGKPDEATLTKDKYKWFRNQADEVLKKLSNNPTLITISIGVNDAKWTNIPALLPHLIEFGGDYGKWVNGLKDEIVKELIGQVSRLLLNHPNVTIIFTTIHNPFNKESIFFHTIVPCNDVLGTMACYDRTRLLIDTLNTIWLDIYTPLGKPTNLRLVPTDIEFVNHASPQPVCGKAAPSVKDTYVQYPGDPYSNGEVPDVVEKLLTHSKYGDCFHPNEKGAQAMADRVYKYIKEALKW